MAPNASGRSKVFRKLTFYFRKLTFYIEYTYLEKGMVT
jgi:hypothetical protein